MTLKTTVARVLLDTPLPQLDHPFDYRIPVALDAAVVAGVRVSVPLRGGTRFADGYVIERVSNADFPGELADIAAVISPVPVLSASTYGLARAVADRQAGSVSDVLRLVMPPRYVRAEKAYLARSAESALATEVATETATETETETSDQATSRETMHPSITGFASWKPQPSGRYVVDAPAHVSELPSGQWVPAWALLLAELAAQTYTAGSSVILAVPDFRDVDVLTAALESLSLDTAVCRVDAKQTGQQRYLNYLRCLEDRPGIIVGNRSAVLTPAYNLGLIALWDDGDENFCEPLAPYAHGRDVALVRQQRDDAMLVLAAHSRTTEAQRLVSVGWAEEVRSDEEYCPKITRADHQNEDENSRHARIPSQAILAARVAAKVGPVLIQVSSPGYASALACASCRERARCNQCSGPLGSPRKGALPTCRWCGLLASTWACPTCQRRELRQLSPGSEGTAEELGRVFPGVRVIVADGNHPVQYVDAGPALIISTPGAEPVAAGGYRAVLLLDGERRRMRETLRVNEDLLRLWSNAAALSSTEGQVFLVGAGEELGAIMETWTQSEFAKHELADRHALRLPPAVRVASISGPLADVTQTCENIAQEKNVRVLGPVGTGDGNSRAIVTFDYRDGDAVASSLRASVIQSATRGSRRVKRPDQPKRVLRLRVRFDDTDIDSL